jgi:hypothetical protein
LSHGIRQLFEIAATMLAEDAARAGALTLSSAE